jgi:hypothetical protein
MLVDVGWPASSGATVSAELDRIAARDYARACDTQEEKPRPVSIRGSSAKYLRMTTTSNHSSVVVP